MTLICATLNVSVVVVVFAMSNLVIPKRTERRIKKFKEKIIERKSNMVMSITNSVTEGSKSPSVTCPQDTKASPFIHKFKSLNENFYVYDVNTNKIIHVNRLIYDIISDFLVLSREEIISKWRYRYDHIDIERALQELAVQHKKGYFSSHRPQKMAMPYSDTFLEQKFRSKIGPLVLNISEQCNLRCKYCCFGGTYKYERGHSNRLMRKDTIEKALSYYTMHSQNSQDPAIAFYGGEALIAFNKIVQAIRFLKSIDGARNYYISIDTNGVLLNKSMIDYIKKNNIRLQISLDGPKSTHDKYRITYQGKPTFEKIMNNLALFRHEDEQLYKEVSFACTLCPSYDLVEINNFFECNELVRNHTLSVSDLDPIDTTFFTDYHENENYSKQCLQIDTLKKHYVDSRINNREPTHFEKSYFDGDFIRIHRRQSCKLGDNVGLNGSCIPGVRKLFVDTDGRYQICEKVGQACYIGDVNRGIGIEQIKKIIDQYINISGQNCLTCWGVRLCSMCFESALQGNNFSTERKKENCEGRLDGLHEDLVTYATIMEANSHAFDFTKNVVIS
jgi:uncharacterized protein